MSDTWTRGHTPDTRRIRVRYVTWRIVDHIVGQRFWTRHGYGSNTVRTRLVDLVPGFNRKKKEEGRREKGEGRQLVDLVPGFNRKKKEEGRREKGEEGKMSWVLGEGGVRRGGGWGRQGGNTRRQGENTRKWGVKKEGGGRGWRAKQVGWSAVNNIFNIYI